MYKTSRILTLILALVWLAAWALTPHMVAVRAQGLDTPTPGLLETSQPIPSPADVINAVNNLRAANGLNVLAVHPVLMEVAALQASALAASEGAVGHERPCGMTLGQQLLSLGYPLWGDLSQDGYRSENWVAAGTLEQVMGFWQSDAEHMNTMVSDFRSDIGAAVAVSDQIYVVLETALSTPTQRMQITAFDILTGIPVTQTVCAGYYDGSISQYSVPVAVSTARPDGDVVHEVKYGQTLWTIAELYHVRVDDIKRLNGLADDTVVAGWKLLIQKGATQPAPLTATSVSAANLTGYPSASPFYTITPSATVAAPAVPVGIMLKQNSTVVAALLIAFSVLLAGMIGFGRQKND
jgi:LysM repeat protein